MPLHGSACSHPPRFPNAGKQCGNGGELGANRGRHGGEGGGETLTQQSGNTGAMQASLHRLFIPLQLGGEFCDAVKLLFPANMCN